MVKVHGATVTTLDYNNEISIPPSKKKIESLKKENQIIHQLSERLLHQIECYSTPVTLNETIEALKKENESIPALNARIVSLEEENDMIFALTEKLHHYKRRMM